METKRIRYLTNIGQAPQLTETREAELRQAPEKLAFRLNGSCQSFIDWDEPDDPVRALVVPRGRELHECGPLDASGEHASTQVLGLAH